MICVPVQLTLVRLNSLLIPLRRRVHVILLPKRCMQCLICRLLNTLRHPHGACIEVNALTLRQARTLRTPRVPYWQLWWRWRWKRWKTALHLTSAHLRKDANEARIGGIQDCKTMLTLEFKMPASRVYHGLSKDAWVL